jgi:hypothetical protein
MLFFPTKQHVFRNNLFLIFFVPNTLCFVPNICWMYCKRKGNPVCILPQQLLISRIVFRFPLSAPVLPLRHKGAQARDIHRRVFLHNANSVWVDELGTRK